MHNLSACRLAADYFVPPNRGVWQSECIRCACTTSGKEGRKEGRKEKEGRRKKGEKLITPFEDPWDEPTRGPIGMVEGLEKGGREIYTRPQHGSRGQRLRGGKA